MDENSRTFIEIVTRETRVDGTTAKANYENYRKFLRPEFHKCFHCTRHFIRPLLRARCIKIQRVVTRARFIDL